MSDSAGTWDTDEWIMHLRKVPMRSIMDIARGRERTPVPFPLYSPFKGPQWWRLLSWMQWNFGDWLILRKKTYAPEQKYGRHRLVRGVPEAAVYRPSPSQDRGEAAPPPQRHLQVPGKHAHVSRRIPA